MNELVKYSPDQPRQPKGVPEGGQWRGDPYHVPPPMGVTARDVEKPIRPSKQRDAVKKEMEAIANKLGLRVNVEQYLGYTDPYDWVMYVDFYHPKWSASRNFLNEGGELLVEHVNMFVDSSAQKQGRSKQFLTALMDAYEKLGVDKINIETTSVGSYAWTSVGSYAWARYGFMPTLSDRMSMQYMLNNRLNGMLEAGLIPKDVHRIAAAAVRYNDTWALSDLRYDVDGEPLGFRLLEGTGWRGEFDLHDKESMDRFNEYTGRKVSKAFDPNQPRQPKGSPEGGQWRGYHGTSRDVEKQILAQGIKSNPPRRNFTSDLYTGQRRRSVFFTDDLDTAFSYAGTAVMRLKPEFSGFIHHESLVFEIEVPKEFVDEIKKDELDFSGLRLERDIPPEWIVGVHRPNKLGTSDYERFRKEDGRRVIYAVVDIDKYAEEHGIEKAYDPNQPRVPAGTSEGGQWASEAGRHATDDEVRAALRESILDAYAFVDDAPAENRNALHYYMRNKFSGFMADVRAGSAKADERVAAIDELLTQRKLTELPYLYRGLKTKDVDLDSDDPFVSTTLTLRQAKQWAGPSGTVLAIEQPAGGFTGFYADRYWNSEKARASRARDPLRGEAEFLLRGARFEKLGESDEQGINVVTVRVADVNKYSPDQPRVPAGSAQGGQFRGYHGTYGRILDSIAREGLVPGRNSKKSVYVSDTYQGARVHAFDAAVREGSRPIILTVNFPDDITLMPDGSGSFRYPGRVPAKWIVGAEQLNEFGDWEAIPIPHRQPGEPGGFFLKSLVRYIVIEDPDEFAKYDPNQPREPKGKPTGGRWKKTTEGGWIVHEREGHEPDLKSLVMWHGTSDEVVEDILSEGLVPSAGLGADRYLEQAWPYLYHEMMKSAEQKGVSGERANSVYVTPDPELAVKFAEFAVKANPGSKAAVLRIDIPASAVPNIKVDEASMGIEAYRHVGVIPPEWLSSYSVAKAAETIRLYAVIVTDESVDKAGKAPVDKAYDPNQPREPKGSPEGGQWISESGQVLNKAPEDKEEYPEHIKKLRIPPAWQDVYINEDPEGILLAIGKDAKGRLQYVYSEAFKQAQSAAKYARLKELAAKFAEMVEQVRLDQRHADSNTRELADLTALIMATGIRPGSERDRGGAVTAFGATTLLGKHLVLGVDGPRLEFTGKKGVNLSIPITDARLGKMLLDRASHAGAGGELFPRVTDASLRQYVSKLGGGSFTPKDFRTHVGTSLARDLVAKGSPPTSMTAYKKAVKSVATAVASKLGNTATVALQSYIDPTTFTPWRAKLVMKSRDYDIWFGPIKRDPDALTWWRGEDDDDPDDEELDETPEDVIAILGFDPKELEKKYDPNQPREPKGTSEGGRWRGYHGSWRAVEKAFDESKVRRVRAGRGGGQFTDKPKSGAASGKETIPSEFLLRVEVEPDVWITLDRRKLGGKTPREAAIEQAVKEGKMEPPAPVDDSGKPLKEDDEPYGYIPQDDEPPAPEPKPADTGPRKQGTVSLGNNKVVKVVASDKNRKSVEALFTNVGSKLRDQASISSLEVFDTADQAHDAIVKFIKSKGHDVPPQLMTPGAVARGVYDPNTRNMFVSMHDLEGKRTYETFYHELAHSAERKSGIVQEWNRSFSGGSEGMADAFAAQAQMKTRKTSSKEYAFFKKMGWLE